MRVQRLIAAVSALTLSTIIATPAVAQDVQDAQDDAIGNDADEDIIVVTATKRPEGIQDVPVSVSAVSGEEISRLGAVDIQELSVYLPNFEYANSGIIPNLFVRGLGSGPTHSIEQSVGRFVDELYIGRAAMSLHGFFDVASVEILRGPQGTLFGKNTAAGAQIINTANPTSYFEAGVDLAYGDYETTGNYTEVQGFLSGPITDNLRGRLAVRYRDDDGFIINRLDGPDGPETRNKGIRAKLEWDATENTTVSFKFEHLVLEKNGSDTPELNGVLAPPVLGILQGISPGFTPELDWIADYKCGESFTDNNRDGVIDPRPIAQGGEFFGSFCPGRDQDTTTLSLRIDHEFEDAGTLTLLTGLQKYDYFHRFQAFDGGIANTFRAFRGDDYESFTTELRFTSELLFDKMDFIAGFYYENSDLSRLQFSDANLLAVTPFPIVLRRNEPWSQNTETIAFFGQVRYDLTDELRLILGGRYSEETKDYEFERFFNVYGSDTLPYVGPTGPFGIPLAASAKRSESKFTPAATLQYTPSDDFNIYASYAQGHKSGGFSDRIDDLVNGFEYDQEIVDSYELGMKGTFFNGSLSANLNFFYMDVSGLQLASIIPGTIVFNIVNAADATSKGIEFDAKWQLNDYWTLGVDYAYIDATFDEFLGSESCPPSAVNANGVCDLSGFQLNWAPKHKGSVYLDYFNDNAFGDWGFGVSANYAVSDDYHLDLGYADTAFENGYGLLGASVRLVSPDENYTLSLVGKNLTNERVISWGGPNGPVTTQGTLMAPRDISLRLSIRY